MIEIGDLVEYDNPNSTIKTIGIVTFVAQIGGCTITVNFGDYEDLIFSLDNIKSLKRSERTTGMCYWATPDKRFTYFLDQLVPVEDK